MTAPLFNLPIANPVIGAAQQNAAAQGPLAGFEALLAAFFGAPGEGADAALAGTPAATQDDQAAAADDPTANATDPTALPTDALSLAAVLAAQQPQQAATTEDAGPEGEASDAPKAATPAGPFQAAAEAEQQARAETGAAVPAEGKPTLPPQAAQAQAAHPPKAVGLTTKANPSDTALAAVSRETADAPADVSAKPTAPEAPQPQTKGGEPASQPKPQAVAQAPAQAPAAAPPPAPAPAAAVETPVEAPSETAQTLAAATQSPAVAVPATKEAPALTTPPKKASEASHRQASGPAARQPAADQPALANAVAPVAETDAAPEGKVSTETAPATPTKEAKSEAIDTPDFQPPAPAASAQANAAAPHAPQVRATSETVANLTAAISKKLEGRSTKFDIELTPAGLGHVSVSVEIAASGKMSAAMSFDSPQAAAELRSRSHELHKALEQAGFDVAGGLTFDVNGDRGEGGRNLAQQQQQNDGAAWRGRAFQAVLGTAGEAAETAASAALHYSRRSDAGVDIRI